ncbi:DUF1835 domain-containing protein [Rhodoligotrophos defluvii]|uniref:DUF1835 domain-containing protein n=1 Tax=Rhodoligotrophos defluvii TaxID=2561934 RepID=UPI0010C96822|nr:DUF1835 domain-containing protein [Rhodoligotrophos defluvii]
MTLIITNGDMVADTLKTAGLSTTIVPWRDTLVDGPVPLTSDLATLDEIRAAFLSEAFAVPRHEIEDEFAARRQQIDAITPGQPVELWFEHDLYDQLQLFQTLDALNRNGAVTNVHLVQANDYLGRHAPDSIIRFAGAKRTLTEIDFEIGSQVWTAYCAATPEAWAALSTDPDLARFPFLRSAMIRAIEELPGAYDGLSRTERRLLQALAEGYATPNELFADNQRSEQAVFLGDWSFWRRLDELAFAPEPLVSGLPERFRDIHCEVAESFTPELLVPQAPDPERIEAYLNAELSLTTFGRAVLSGQADHVERNGIDRWWGGTHLTTQRCWRWDDRTQGLVAPAPAG